MQNLLVLFYLSPFLVLEAFALTLQHSYSQHDYRSFTATSNPTFSTNTDFVIVRRKAPAKIAIKNAMLRPPHGNL